MDICSIQHDEGEYNDLCIEMKLHHNLLFFGGEISQLGQLFFQKRIFGGDF